MIIILKSQATEEQVDSICKKIEDFNCKHLIVNGLNRTSISVIGKTESLDSSDFQFLEGVESTFRVSKPFKQASLCSCSERTKIFPGTDTEISDQTLITMTGPCSVESEEQMMRIGTAVKKAGTTFLRGGSFKPRSSPYSFQGMGEEGLKILKMVSEETGLKIISELMDIKHLDIVYDHVDIIQIGARNMQNFDLLKEVGKVDKPVMLKRGPSATIEEWLMSAEYIMVGGNSQVILCERGIRSFDTQYSRNTLDLNVVPIVKNLSHLPIIVDPSHGTGVRHLVAPMAKAAIAAGADGVMVEVHDRPKEALSDGPQSLLPHQYTELANDLEKMAPMFNKKYLSSKES